MRIRDTLTGEKRSPDTSGTVGIYVCGVTVYDEAHVGHARTIIVFDVLRRYLQSRGATVKMVQNFTDVDDKIIERASAQGLDAAELGGRYITRYFEDSDALNVMRAATYPRATEHIPEILEMIQGLLESGAAYVTRNGVYFAVSGFPGYGRLSKKRTEELRSGARVQVDEHKRDPLDFALWKFAGSGPFWESPWGSGRPGWHIECSAMSLKYLGESFEIHGGGRDLIFPHHENEIAQSEAFTSKPPARLWMHVGMVTIGGQKMSKSLGNMRSVRLALERWGPNVIRLFCLSAHYAKPVDHSDELLRGITSRWRQAEAAYHELLHMAGCGGIPQGYLRTWGARPHQEPGKSERVPRTTPPSTGRLLGDPVRRAVEAFDGALDDDLNTHMALDAFFGLVRAVNVAASGPARQAPTAGDAQDALYWFNRMAWVLGLRMPEVPDADIPGIRETINGREELRKQGRYGEADRIRDELSRTGIELVDHGSGTVWIKREHIAAEQAGTG